MSSNAETSGDDLWPDDGQQVFSASTQDDDDTAQDDALDDPFADTADWFSDELENVSASDWDIDTAQMWGGDEGYGGAEEGGESGFGLSL